MLLAAATDYTGRNIFISCDRHGNADCAIGRLLVMVRAARFIKPPRSR